MAHIVVTLEHKKERRDLALPSDVSARLLVEALTDALKIKGQYSIGIKSEQGIKPLPINASLGDLGVLHGAVFTLLEGQRGANTSPVDASQVRLQVTGGPSFTLMAKTTLIGRNDPKRGIFVDVDLGTLVSDPKIISRRHAQIEKEGQRYYLADLDSTNGTNLNGKPLPKNNRQLLASGDEIVFGRNGVRLTFFS